jgi:hypothetical protein
VWERDFARGTDLTLSFPLQASFLGHSHNDLRMTIDTFIT